MKSFSVVLALLLIAFVQSDNKFSAEPAEDMKDEIETPADRTKRMVAMVMRPAVVAPLFVRPVAVVRPVVVRPVVAAVVPRHMGMRMGMGFIKREAIQAKNESVVIVEKVVKPIVEKEPKHEALIVEKEPKSESLVAEKIIEKPKHDGAFLIEKQPKHEALIAEKIAEKPKHDGAFLIEKDSKQKTVDVEKDVNATRVSKRQIVVAVPTILPIVPVVPFRRFGFGFGGFRGVGFGGFRGVGVRGFRGGLGGIGFRAGK